MDGPRDPRNHKSKNCRLEWNFYIYISEYFSNEENPLFNDFGDDETEEGLVDGTDDLDYTPSTVSDDSGYSFPEEARVTSSTDSGVMQSSVSRINSIQRHEGCK